MRPGIRYKNRPGCRFVLAGAVMPDSEAMTLVKRSLHLSDVAALAELLSVASGGGDYAGEEALRRSLGDPCCDLERGSVAIFGAQALAGYGVLKLRGAEDVRYEGAVHPAYRGRGLGGELLAWAERAVRPLCAERFGAGPVLLRSSCASGDDAAVRLHEGRGYQTVRVFWSMTRELTTPPGDAPLPDGLRIAEFTAERAADALLVRNEAFRDHWSTTATTAAQWAYRIGGYLAGYSYLVYRDAEPLGVLLGRQDGQDLYIAVVGTRAAGRNRGIATALLARAVSDARAAGLATASLNVDSTSPTGAAGLYKRAGFTVAAARTVYEKALR